MLRICTLAFVAISAVGVSQAQKRAGELPAKVQAQLLQEGFLAEDIADLIVQDDYRSANNGLRHLFLRQRWQGVEVWNGDIAIHLSANGEVVKLNNGAWSRLAKRTNATTPIVTAEAALSAVLRSNKIIGSTPLTSFNATEKEYVFDGSSFSVEPVKVKLVYQPMKNGLKLAWNVNHYTTDGSHWWNVRIDAITGVELERNDWVAQCAFDHGEEPPPASPNDYNVFGWPVETPIHGPRTLRNAPWTDGGVASPYGWHDTNGAAGAEYTITRGNNVYASEDADANNVAGVSPSGGATLDFDFPLDLSLAPSGYLNAATTNLFYWNNLMHDVWYQYGFDDPSGNFQSNNYGRGGAGNDFVNADAQDGSGTNNANFGTPPDGSSPRMQMYRWTYTTPNRDSDLDNGIIAHEYGHGISNRLVGGPSNTSCLGNAEQMGEGWSDYFGLMMTLKAGDLGTNARGIGTYVIGEPVTGGGIRPAPYSTNFSQNSFTYANTNSGVSQPHGIGFVWCTMLWEMTWELINVYGLDPDIYNGTGGNNLAMQLVIDGLKLTPCNPGFVDGRDAILQADALNNGGANQAYIWAAFARRGLGVSASQGSSSNRSDQVEAFNTPVANDLGIASILEPVPGLLFECNNAPFTVRATVRNDGQQTQTGFPVSYQLDGGAVITETFAGSLTTGQSAVHVFTTPLSVLGVGDHTFVVAVSLAGDGYLPNNSKAVVLTLSAASNAPLPFVENVNSGVVAPPGWTLQNPDNATTWTTFALSNGPACASTTSWRIDNYGYNAPGQLDQLITPLISLGGAAGTHLLFDHSYAPYSSTYNDGFRVEVSNTCGSSWTQVFYAVGAGLATTAATTAAYVPSNCNQWLAHDIDLSAYDGQSVLLRFTNINDYGNYLYLDNVSLTQNGLKVALKVMLDGPYDSTTGKMRDDLRVASLIPMAEPYSALGYTQASDGGGETMLPVALTSVGDNAIVDWVQVELRDAVTPSVIVATRPALIQRDGDVVDVDGSSSIALLAPAANYFVVVKHRNHFGVMTTPATALSTSSTSTIDLTIAATGVFGTAARKDVAGMLLLWSGNVLRDSELKYIGPGNDRDPILLSVGGTTPNNVINGYRLEDVNMDGAVKYIGPSNDRDPLLINVGSTTPNSVRVEQLP